jgi:hypothetical protein
MRPPEGRGTPTRHAHGAVLLLVVLAVFAFAAAAVALASAGRHLDDPRTLDERQQQWLRESRAQILDWYAGQLATLDAPLAPAPRSDEAFAGAGVQPRWGARFAAGPLRIDAQVGWRDLLLWLPATADDSTGIDPQDGTVRVDPQVRHAAAFSSRPLQLQAWARSEQLLRTLAQLAEQRFDMLQRVDVTHDRAVNAFRAPDGICRLDTDQLPCASTLTPGTWTPVAQLAAHSLAFGRAADAGLPERNAWGGPLLWSNDLDPTFLQPPYSMAFTTFTPWSTAITVRAVQP